MEDGEHTFAQFGSFCRLLIRHERLIHLAKPSFI
jgi:hypothetical protein